LVWFALLQESKSVKTFDCMPGHRDFLCLSRQAVAGR